MLNHQVIIVGAGPAGLLLAILLAKQDIRVTVLEKSVEIDRNPRASFYSSPAIYELRRAGLMEDIMKKAFVPSGVAWRHMDGAPICSLNSENPPGAETMVSLPLDELLPIMMEHLKKYSSAEILFDHEVVSIGQNPDTAWVEAKTPSAVATLSASYIVGCDGGNSTIRRLLFDGKFPGFTWDKQIVATNVYYPRFKDFGWTSSSFLLHPQHFPMIALIANDGLLRITYGEEGGLSHDEMKERQPDKFRAFVPGHPEPDEYNIVNFSPYKIHQRSAEKYRVGRFLLAADAAHLCNPL
jgi:2-polyprenyl-6-methoxyphenol hydroxylase-like FAD-dependent oxidoreductase